MGPEWCRRAPPCRLDTGCKRTSGSEPGDYRSARSPIHHLWAFDCSDEGLGVMVGLLDVTIDGALKVEHRAEDAPFQSPLGEGGEEGLHRVEPGTGGRGEVEGEARMAGEPGDHLGMLVGGIVVEDDVDELAGRDVRLDDVQEADEFLVAMALHVATDDVA